MEDCGFGLRLIYGGLYRLGLLDENLKRRGIKRFMKARRVGRQAQIMATSISMVLGGGGGGGLANLR